MSDYSEQRKKEVKVPKKRGRPPKALVQSKKKGARPPGRPPGDKAIMDEYKARLLASPKSRKVLDTILDAALDDEHKHQAAAWKLLVDRLMPLSSFDASTGGGDKPSINITISGVTEVENIIDGEVIDNDNG